MLNDCFADMVPRQLSTGWVCCLAAYQSLQMLWLRDREVVRCSLSHCRSATSSDFVCIIVCALRCLCYSFCVVPVSLSGQHSGDLQDWGVDLLRSGWALGVQKQTMTVSVQQAAGAMTHISY